MPARESSTNQLSLDLSAEGVETLPGTFDFDAEFRAALNKAIKDSRFSRAAIAARMTELIYGDSGEGAITKAMLDARTAQSRAQYAFPVAWLPAFCIATGDSSVLERIAARAGRHVLTSDQLFLTELGTAIVAERDARAKVAALRKSIKPGMAGGGEGRR